MNIRIFAARLAEDGAFIPIINGEPIPVAQGREVLAEISGGGANQCRNVGWIEQGVHHVYTNHVIDPTPEGAAGRT